MASASTMVGTEEKCNGTKLTRLLIDCGTETMRRTFDSIILPAHLPSVLHTHKSLLKSLLKKRVLSYNQWDKLYPPGGSAPDSKTFDISLLFVLLRTYRICGLTSPATGWDALPPAADVSREANLARIKFYRNQVHGHVTGTGVSKADFEQYWKDISGALTALRADKVAIDDLKSSPIGANDYTALLTELSCDLKEAVKESVRDLRTEVQKQNTSKPASLIEMLSKFDFAQHTQTLVEDHFQEGTRKWVLDEIDNFCTNQEVLSRVLVIRALPGVGKSVLAAVACRNAQEKDYLAACHFIQYNNTERNNPKMVIESIVRHLCDTVEGFKETLHVRLSSLQPDVRMKLQEMNLETLMCALVEEPLSALQSFSTKPNIVIVIDALDEIEPSSREEFRKVLFTKSHNLPKWIKFVLTSRPTQQLLEEVPNVTVINIEEADHSNTEDVRLYLSKELQSLYRDEPTEKLENVTTKLAERSRGTFLYAHFAIVSAKKKSLSLSETSELFPKGISLVYEEYIARLQTKRKLGREKFRNFLKAIIAAQAPLPQSLVLQILSFNEQDEKEMTLARETLKSLSLLFPIENGYLSVFHKSLADWLTVAKYSHECHDFSVTVIDGHRILAKHCLKVLRDVKNHKRFPPELNDSENYALTFGFHHMLEAGGYKEQLGECVQDLKLLAAMWVARGKTTLRVPSQRKDKVVEELKHIIDRCPLPDKELLHLCKVMKAVRVQTDFPQFVLQCATNCPSTVLSSKASQFLSSPKCRNCIWMERQEIHSFKEPLDVVSCRPSEHTVTCVCKHGPNQWTVITFNIEDGRQLAEVDLTTQTKLDAFVQVSPSDKYVVVYDEYDRKLQLRDVWTLQIQKKFEVEDASYLLSCCFVPDNKLAAGCEDKTVRVWDVESGAVKTTLQCLSGEPWYCTASKKGQLLTVEMRGKKSYSAVLWPGLTSTPVQLASDEFPRTPFDAESVSFSPDGSLVACLCGELLSGIVKVFNVATTVLQTSFTVGMLGFWSCIVFVDDSHILIKANSSSYTKVANVNDGSSHELAAEPSLVYYQGSRKCVAIDCDSRRTLYKLSFHKLR